MLEFIDLHTGSALVRRPPFVLCLGNFDGVHIGHRALIDRTVLEKSQEAAKYSGILGGAWCFRQPPADFLSESPPPRITDTDEKLRLLADAGLDVAVLADFPTYRDMSPESFVSDLLTGECNCKRAVCGFNFRFGRGGKGTPDVLRGLPDGVAVLDPVRSDGVTVSSSAIRRLLLTGDVETANTMLGRPFSICLPVIYGRRLGSRIGSPTINQSFTDGVIIPAHGVYVGTAETADGRVHRAAINVGTNPTVKDDGRVVCETHLLDFDGDIYGERVRVSFLSRLRGEIRFGSTNELADAIKKDIAKAEDYFSKNEN